MMPPEKLAACFALDLVAGDPEWFSFHPVRMMGKAIHHLETQARRIATSPAEEMIAGAAITALLAGGGCQLPSERVIAKQCSQQPKPA